MLLLTGYFLILFMEKNINRCRFISEFLIANVDIQYITILLGLYFFISTVYKLERIPSRFSSDFGYLGFNINNIFKCFSITWYFVFTLFIYLNQIFII